MFVAESTRQQPLGDFTMAGRSKRARTGDGGLVDRLAALTNVSTTALTHVLKVLKDEGIAVPSVGRAELDDSVLARSLACGSPPSLQRATA